MSSGHPASSNHFSLVARSLLCLFCFIPTHAPPLSRTFEKKSSEGVFRVKGRKHSLRDEDWERPKCGSLKNEFTRHENLSLVQVISDYLRSLVHCHLFRCFLFLVHHVYNPHQRFINLWVKVSHLLFIARVAFWGRWFCLIFFESENFKKKSAREKVKTLRASSSHSEV